MIPVATDAEAAGRRRGAEDERQVVSPLAAAELAIARLEGRVAALEAALERRSGELRRLQSHLCQRDLALWTRMEAGLPPLPSIAHEPAFWQETLELAGADVPETMEDLWASLYPAPPARTAP